MPASETDLIRPIYEEWGRGNWRPRFQVYADDMEWGWSDEFPGLAGVGHDVSNFRLRDGKVVGLEILAGRERAGQPVGLEPT